MNDWQLIVIILGFWLLYETWEWVGDWVDRIIDEWEHD